MSAQTDSHQLSIQTTEDRDHDHRVAEKLMFATDEQLAGWLRPAEARLHTVENFVQDMKARLPGIERGCAAIAQNIGKVREQLERAA